MSVSIQTEDFDLGAEVATLSNGRADIGALVTFTGVVRQNAKNDLISMELEHYPAMTEAALVEIEDQAITRWNLSASRIIHRVGNLKTGAQIMMVAVAAPHRGAAFEAADFLMDYLKSRAPFWKKEHRENGSSEWVSAQVTDEERLSRW